MAALDFLFGSTPPSTYLTPTYQENQYPAWYQEASQGLLTKASGIANEPYTPYQGPRLAGLDPLQQQAIDNAGAAGSSGAATLTNAANTAGNAATLFDQGQFDQFKSPYTEGVVNRIAELGQRNLTENLLPSVNSSFIGSGMPFGSRHADFTARALRDTNESVLGQQALTLQQAQQQAMQDYQGALGRQGTVGGIQAGIGNAQTENDINTGKYQTFMGALPQDLAQKNLNLAYGDFQNQKNYPKTQLDIVNSILKGYSPLANQTQYEGSPMSSAQAQSPIKDSIGALAKFFG
jgi:hypothetical protein